MTSNFLKTFRAARRVSTPLVCVRTADPASTIELVVTKVLNGDAAATPLLEWDVLRGIQGRNDAGKLVATQILKGAKAETASNRPSDALRMMQGLAEDSILFLHNAHRFWTDPVVSQGVWNLRDTLKANGAMLVLLACPGATAPTELSQDVYMVDEPLPSREEIGLIIDDTYQGFIQQARQGGVNLATTLDEATRTKAVDALAGIAAYPAEQSFSMSLTNDGVDVKQLWDRKCSVIEQTPGLKVHRGKAPEPRGLENAKSYLRRVMTGRDAPRIILFADEVEKGFSGTGTELSGVQTKLTGMFCTWTAERDTDGFLAIGIPGGGKSMLAKWLGAEFNVPVILWNMGEMESGIIGSSQERMGAVFGILDAIADGRVLILGTCNSITALPPEIRRRFNPIFFFDLLSADEREQVWEFYEGQYEVQGDRPDDTGWTGAEIRQCVRTAHRLNIPLQEAASYIVPVSQSAAEQINELRNSANGRYLSASYPGKFTVRTEAAGAPKASRKFRASEGGPKVLDGRGGNA
jgi:hypothetical protein